MKRQLYLFGFGFLAVFFVAICAAIRVDKLESELKTAKFELSMQKLNQEISYKKGYLDALKECNLLVKTIKK